MQTEDGEQNRAPGEVEDLAVLPPEAYPPGNGTQRWWETFLQAEDQWAVRAQLWGRGRGGPSQDPVPPPRVAWPLRIAVPATPTPKSLSPWTNRARRT